MIELSVRINAINPDNLLIDLRGNIWNRQYKREGGGTDLTIVIYIDIDLIYEAQVTSHFRLEDRHVTRRAFQTLLIGLRKESCREYKG